jgi:hypothetical protein
MMRSSPPAPDALPAFLIDADRQTTHRPPNSGAFDNRSVVFATDFPSAARLAAHGITQALLVREGPAGLGADLRYALQTWQQAGVRLNAKWLTAPGGPVPLALPRPRWWFGLWGRLTAALGFRRGAGGEFGGFVPNPSGG